MIAGLIAFAGASGAQDEDSSDQPVVTIAEGPTPVTEGTTAEFVVSRTGLAKEALTVSLDVAETGSMISGTAPTSIVLSEGEESKKLLVPTEQDDRNETDSAITATVLASTGATYEVGAESAATVNVEDDDRPSLSLSVQPDSVSEEDGVATVTAGLGVTFDVDQEISLTFSGTAEMGTDYTVGTETLVLAAGERSVETVITAVNDDVAEDVEAVFVNARHAGTDSTVERRLLILDDDSSGTVVRFTASTISIPEGAEARYSFGRSGATTEPLTVSLDISETGSMISGAVPTSVVFDVGVSQKGIVFRTEDDLVEEPDSVITVALVAGPDAPYVVTADSFRLTTVRDDDEGLQVEVPSAPLDLAAVADGPTRIELSWNEPEPPTVEGDGSAIVGYRIEWSADGSSDWSTLVGDTGSDATRYTDSGLSPETTRHYRVSATNSVGTGPASNTASATTEVEPPSNLPVITVEPRSEPIVEGELALFGVIRTPAAEEELEALLEVSVSNSLGFTRGPLWVLQEFRSGDGFGSYGLFTVDNDVDEPERIVTVKVLESRDGSYVVGSPSSATVAVRDNDDLAVDVTTAVVGADGVAVTEVAEDIGTATIRVTATTRGSLPPTEAFGVSVTSRAGSATSPDDFEVVSSQVSFGVGDWVLGETDRRYSAVKDIPLAIFDDALAEDRESLGLITEMSAGTPAYVSLPGRIELAIVDDDAIPGPPTDLEATANGETTIDLSWNAPSGDVNPPLTGYRIEWSLDGTSDWVDLVEDTESAATTYVDDGLTAGTTRHYRVSAINSLGTGEPSESASATTAPPPPPLPPALPEVTMTAGPTPVTEGTDATFVVSRTGSTEDELSVSLEVSETGSMISGEAPTSVVFPAGAEQTTLNIPTVDDEVDEPDSVITATITAGQDAPYTLGSEVSRESTVTDNDEASLVLSVEQSSIPEAGGVATIVVSVGEVAFAEDQEIALDLSGEAVKGTDYTVESDTLTLVAGEKSVETAVTAMDDDLVEGHEAIIVAASHAGSPVGGTQTIMIADDDMAVPEIRFEAWTTQVMEGADAVFSLVRTGPTADALVVSVEVTETVATIEGSAPTSVSFDPGAATAVLTLATDDDRVPEPDSVITATLTLEAGAEYTIGSPASASATVEDDDDRLDPPPPPSPLPEVTISVGPAPVVEGTDATFVVSRTGSTEDELSVSVEVTETGSMISGETPISVVFPADAERTTLNISTVDDEVDEPDSVITATLTLEAGAEYTIGSPASASATVEDDDDRLDPPPPPSPLPEVTISVGPAPVVEGTDATFVVSRTGSTEDELSVSVEVTETGSMISGETPTSVVFPADAERTTLNISTVDDEMDEPDSEITATLTAAPDAGYVAGTPSSATVTVQDDEPSEVARAPEAPTDLVAVADGESAIDLRWAAPEDEGNPPLAVYAIEWSPDGRSGWTRLADTRPNVTTYRDVGLTQGATRYYRVCAMNSVGPSPVSNVAGATTELPPPEVTIRAANGPIDEGAEATFALRRTGPASEPLTVYLDVALAESMVDAPSPASADFPAGAAETMLTISTVDDSLDEPDREITVTLLEGDGYTLANETSATVQVRDNDAAPLLSVAGASAPESAAELTFQVSLAGQTSMPVRVAWSTSAGTASSEEDYAAANGVLSFEADATSARIIVAVRDDALFEDDETFTVTLSRPENARLSDTASSAAGVIENDDAAPVFRIADAAAPESAGQISFTVSLSGGSALPATVRWTSAAETAQPDLDYVEGNGELTFAPGTTNQRLAVTVLEDSLMEDAETFRVALSEATNATFETGLVATATGTIQDDDDTTPAEEWLARFGRTAASNAVDAVEDRLTGRLGSGDQVVVAGHRVDVAGNGATRSGPVKGAAGSSAAPVRGLGGIGQAAGGAAALTGFGGGLLDTQPGRYGSGRMDVGDVLARSSFHFSSDSHAAGYGNRGTANGAAHGGDGGNRWSVWGSGASTRFDGGEETLSLDGEVMTGTVGADIERGRVLFGVAVSHSRGDGDYRRDGVGGLRAREGDLSSDLTTGLPYLRVAVSDRLSVWGALGRGSGSMTLSEGGLGSIDADIAMTLGAFGARQELRSAATTDGFSLALRTDLLLVHTTSDETEALPALSTDVNRLRLMLEGARRLHFDSGVVLTPTVEIGLRYDDGDAETGSGVEVGAGLRLEDAARGGSVELTGRSLLAHEASELSEWGVAGSLRFEPGGGDRGLAIGLRSTLGAASSGIARLWEQQNAAPVGYRAAAPGSVTEAEIGYGLAVLGSRGSLTPYLGAGLSDRSGGAYRVGARLRVGEFFALDAEAARVERNDATPSLYRAALLASLRW